MSIIENPDEGLRTDSPNYGRNRGTSNDIFDDGDEGRLAIRSAYLGIQILRDICRVGGLGAGERRSDELLAEMDAAFPWLAK